MTAVAQTYAVTDEWLNASTTNANCTDNGIHTIWWPSTWYYQSCDPRPITLKFSEIEFLRKQASKDKKLRAILQKFTPLIRIEVDF